MRELTKSMTTFTWAMSVFGVQQVLNLATGGAGDQADQCAESFNHVSQASADTLGSALKAIYGAGDRLQSDMVDLLLGSLRSGVCDPRLLLRMGTEAMQQATTTGAGAAAGRGGACCGPSTTGPRMPNVPSQASPRR